MSKEFVPYELAVKLKEIGFNEPCFAIWSGETLDMSLQIPSDDYFTKAPTFSQVFRWFREKYGDYLLYSFGVIPHFTIIQNLIFEDSKITYEEAELACLNKLISIVEQQKQN